MHLILRLQCPAIFADVKLPRGFTLPHEERNAKMIAYRGFAEIGVRGTPIPGRGKRRTVIPKTAVGPRMDTNELGDGAATQDRKAGDWRPETGGAKKTFRKESAGWALAGHALKSPSWIPTCLIVPKLARKRTSRRDAEAQRESEQELSASPRLCVTEMTSGEGRMKTFLKKQENEG